MGHGRRRRHAESRRRRARATRMPTDGGDGIRGCGCGVVVPPPPRRVRRAPQGRRSHGAAAARRRLAPLGSFDHDGAGERADARGVEGVVVVVVVVVPRVDEGSLAGLFGRGGFLDDGSKRRFVDLEQRSGRLAEGGGGGGRQG